MKNSVLCLAIVFIAATAPASASDTGFYLGAGIGQSAIDIKEFYPSLGDSLEQDSDAFKAYGGYRFLKCIAVEAGYTNLGSPQGLERNVPEHPETAEVSVKGWDAFAVGILPVGNVVDIFGKIGMMSWDTKITSVQDGEVRYSESSTGTDTAYGIGIGFWVGKNVTLRGEGEWFKIGDYQTVALYSFNVTYTF
jgi:opacity protein-like surface antigen